MGTTSARLRLLDLQVVDADGQPIARVDDVELAPSGDEVSVVALACGQGALGRRLGGTLGRQLQASAARLRTGADAERTDGVTRIPTSLVGEVSSVVTLTRSLADLHGVAGLERWLTAHVIGRLPGAGEPPAASQNPLGTGDHPAAPMPGELLLSRLLDAPVHDSTGELVGIVHDLRLRAGDASGDVPLGAVDGLVVGPDGWRSRLAHAWGYAAQPRSGPAVLRLLLAPYADQARVVPADQVRSWTEPVVISGPPERYPTLHEREDP